MPNWFGYTARLQTARAVVADLGAGVQRRPRAPDDLSFDGAGAARRRQLGGIDSLGAAGKKLDTPPSRVAQTPRRHREHFGPGESVAGSLSTPHSHQGR